MWGICFLAIVAFGKLARGISTSFTRFTVPIRNPADSPHFNIQIYVYYIILYYFLQPTTLWITIYNLSTFQIKQPSQYSGFSSDV